ncbi:MAG: hypothetical protein WCL27_17455 [Betaproteobacteria bacterium]
MTLDKAPLSSVTERGTHAAVIFALVAERLSTYYEHGQWPTEAQGASLLADWLSRSKRSLPLAERKHLSALSDQLARKITKSLSREAGLYTVHEMMESLDPNYYSEIGGPLMAECERVLDGGLAA